MKIFNFKKYINILNEGLIKTHNIIEYEDIIIRYLKKHDVEYEIEIVNNSKFNLNIFSNFDQIDDINKLINNLGYFVSYYVIKLNNGMENRFKLLSDFKNNNASKVTIVYNSKFDNNKIKIPNKLYHLSSDKNDKSIDKIGLSPRTKNRISNHPDRIYLFSGIENTDSLKTSLKWSDFNNMKNINYSLYEINTVDLNIKINKDPDYVNGFYTNDNIPPRNIKRINF